MRLEQAHSMAERVEAGRSLAETQGMRLEMETVEPVGISC
jgi:hypothetical protein